MNMDESTNLLLERIALLHKQIKNERDYPRMELLDELIRDLEQTIERGLGENAALTREKEALTRQNLEIAHKHDILARQKEALERQNQSLERQCKTLERHNTNLLRQNSLIERQNAALEERRLALESERRHFHNLFKYGSDASLITDVNGAIQEANQAAAGLLYSTPQELKGENLLNYIASEQQNLVVAMITHLQRAQDVEVRLQPYNHPPLDVSITLSTLHDETGKPFILQWILRDITERHQAMSALNASERRFRTIFNEANIGILLLDLEGKIVRANRVLQEILGYGEDELYNRTISELTCPEDPPIQNAWRLLHDNRQGQVSLENRLRRRDGQFVWANISLSTMRGDKEQVLYVIGMVKDITKEKQSAAELSEMRRRLLESGEAEQLRLAQVLHDGPTQDIYSAVFRLSNCFDLVNDSILHDNLKAVQDQLKTVANTLRDIVGELRPPTIGNLGLERAIRSHADKVQELHPDLDIKLHLTRDGQIIPPLTRMALFRIYQQCMSNILRHAQASQAVVAFHTNSHEISMDIWDNGKGFIPPQKWVDLLREGHHGLASIAERVQVLGGVLKVESKPGSGTLVHISAPCELNGKQ